MSVTVANIIVGEGNLFLSTSTTDATLVNIGSTQGGVTISWEPSFVEIEVDQFGDAAKLIQEKMKSMVNTTMAEATLANLAYAWGYKTGLIGADTANLASEPGVSGSVFNFGIHSAYPAERRLRVEGPNPNATPTTLKRRIYTCNRVVSYNAVESKHARNENVALAVQFRVLPDPTQTGKEYGTIQDEA